MKKLLFILLIGLSLQAYSQVEFAPEGAEWYSSAYGTTSLIPPMTQYDLPIHHKYDRDTMINGIAAKVIVNTYYNYYNTDTESDEHILTQSGDSILIWRAPEFHLLYDFGAEIGETIQTRPTHDNVYDLTLIGKDTVSINGENLIDYIYSVASYSTLIVNNKFGAINNFLIYSFQIDGDIGKLRCYSDNNFELYQLGDIACDSIYSKYITETTDISEDLILRIHPNPTTDIVIIELPVKGIRQKRIKITNLQGRIVLDTDSFEGEVELDISKLTPGFYSVDVFTQNRRFLGNFIKIKE